MRVVLYRVGRNLNRAMRTCEAFGVSNLDLCECAGAYERGNLYAAAGRVTVGACKILPSDGSVLALETNAGIPIENVDWSAVETVMIGGETSGLPRSLPVKYAHIKMRGNVSGLTVEGALAITLHEWNKSCR